MPSARSTWIATYGAVIAILAGIASALGVFARGDGAYTTVTSVRGVTYEMATSGVYANNAQQVVAEGVGWDIFTLVVIVPALLGAAWFVARGSYGARLISLGLFGYMLYQYLEYAMTWAIGPLFPLFIVLVAGALAGLVWVGWSVAREGVAGRFDARFPRRSFATVNVAMALLLTAMWIGRIAAALSGDLLGAGVHGETTMVVQALDLGIVVPTAVFVSALAWRRVPAGGVLAAVYGITGLAMSFAIVSMLVTAGIVNGEMAWPPIAIFTAFGAISVVVVFRIYGALTGPATVGARPGLQRLSPRPVEG